MTHLFDRAIAEAERLRLRWRLKHNDKGTGLYLVIDEWLCITHEADESMRPEIEYEVRRTFARRGRDTVYVKRWPE